MKIVLTKKTNIGQFIKNERLRQQMNQVDLSDLSGVSQPVISRVESGICNPNFDAFLKIMSALGLKVEVTKL